jgi:uncharacterized protein (DUF362 family)
MAVEVTRSADHAATQLDRRALLLSGGAALAGVCAAMAFRFATEQRAATFLAGGQRYDGPLEQTIRHGLLAVGLDPLALRGKRVLLKPNLVEPTRACPQMTTHPAIVTATAEVFRRWDASVTVGEGPGHVRDTEMALVESGLDDALRSANLQFVDLNYDEIGKVANAGRTSNLKEIYFPRAVLEADLVVSLPKLKTHHWVGVTAAMKNLYGTLPGIKYGWPKNVLHYAGIPQTVVDINASLPRTIAVIDGIVCMEGDGPILGTAKPLGLLAIGTNLPALDATCARIMGINPERISYLNLAADRLGPIAESRIEQRGDDWKKLYSPFEILDEPHLRGLRAMEALVT